MMNRFILVVLLTGCGAPQTPTPAGLVIYYDAGEKRLSREKAQELDERHAALLKCLPPEAIKRHEPPVFAIEGTCDTFQDPWTGQHLRGFTYLNGNRKIILPGSLGAAAHEMTHYYTGEVDLPRPQYLGTWLFKCGDLIDGEFRKLYPPRKCEGEK